MITILDEIIDHKRQELIQRKKETPVSRLEKCPFFSRTPISLKASLNSEKASGIIAEYKRMSPSAGWINQNADPVDITRGYIKAGASALSVLTDRKYFAGKRDDLIRVRETNESPILRKEFMIDEYQVVEAKAIGADAILLIASVLDNTRIMELSKLAHSLGMEVLMEVHEAAELAYLNDWIDIVGVNNRDLKKMETDVQTSVDMAGLIPDRYLKISESGINNPETVKKLKKLGYKGFLVGEYFMQQDDPIKSCSGFIKKIISH